MPDCTTITDIGGLADWTGLDPCQAKELWAEITDDYSSWHDEYYEAWPDVMEYVLAWMDDRV